MICVELIVFRIGQIWSFYHHHKSSALYIMEKEDKGKEQCHHGLMLKELALKAPKLVAKSNQLSRPGYSTIDASEYEDHPDVLKIKVKELAALIRKSTNCVVYTGAGISRASGIADYASKAKNTKAGQENHSLNRLHA